MSAIAILMALVTQGSDGNVAIVPGLSRHSCAEARCVALYSRTCEKQAMALAAQARHDAAIKAQAMAALKVRPKLDHFCIIEGWEQTCFTHAGIGHYDSPHWLAETDPGPVTFSFDSTGAGTTARVAECIR